ncbi:hypothetical protein E1B28_001006 [Marasmius oreades]|uniref:RNase III domain-containing protein n=1 Tax=Marasmius oreades TaxID=181124 RepID=A0A9P8AEZ4_9AGAR|nr:uncharacterized protein E1B28_001006 [Marasmius oreades]KAG7099134.1 hypothetical protein E1B28_001006 [Marasmius oreades]
MPDLGYKHIQRNIVELIKNPHFHLQLPKLSDDSWNKMLRDSLERDRLEFLGDALMTSFVAQRLYRFLSEGTAHYYSQARSALTANATFAHIMARLGHFDMEGPMKPAGDAFESIIGAYYKEGGPEALQQWQEQFFPLIRCAAKVCRSMEKPQTRSKTRHKSNHILSRLRRPPTPNIISPLRNRKRRTHLSVLPPSLAVGRIPKPVQTPVSKLPPRVIDLTAESEPEGSAEIVEICAQDFCASKARTKSSSQLLNTVSHALPATPAPIRRLYTISTPGGPNNPIAIDD